MKETPMHWISTGVAALSALGIIAIGLLYLFAPRSAMRSFGLPLPDGGASVAWWLRLKGVRDIVAGAVVLAVMTWGGPRILGIVLAVEAFIAIGDGSLILAASGQAKAAWGMHYPTAAIMIAAAIPLILGPA
jgi:hypothetical protein